MEIFYWTLTKKYLKPYHLGLKTDVIESTTLLFLRAQEFLYNVIL